MLVLTLVKVGGATSAEQPQVVPLHSLISESFRQVKTLLCTQL